MDTTGKKRLWIFIAVAYGVTAVMSILMYIGFRQQMDLTAFVNTQMMYPACGVILGKMIASKEDEKLPMAGYIAVLVTTAVMMIISIMSVFIKLPVIDMGEAGKMDPWVVISQLPLIPGSIAAYICFWVCGRERAENAGLRRKNIGMSVVMIVLFLALYFGRIFGSVFLNDLINGNSEAWDSLKASLMTPAAILNAVSLPFNFFFVFLAFFGEEYGWRYYLQPILQNKFGKRLGVIILGIVWGIWHLNVDLMFYTKETQIQMFVSQLITCTAYGILFGYAYMKTNNIWVPVIIHFLNNNLIAVIYAGNTDVIQNQSVTWGELPLFFLTMLPAMLFILAPIYGKGKNKASGTVVEVRDAASKIESD